MDRRDFPEIEDDLYSRPDEGAGVVLWLFCALLALVFSLMAWAASAQEPAVTEPRGVNLILPKGASVVDGRLNLLPDAVDAVARTQTPEYLQKVAASLLPRAQEFAVGRIEGGPGPSTVPVYISGRVVELAAKVQLRVDGAGPYYEAVLRPTRGGYPKTWTWEIPAALQDGKAHKVYARALRTTGTVIGPLDNAKAASPWTFTVGSVPPIVVPVPPIVTPEPAPPPVLTKCGRIDAYDPATRALSGVVTADASHAEIRAGNVNYGLRPVTEGKWTAVTALAAGSYTAVGQALRRSGPNRDGPWEVICGFDATLPFTVPAANGVAP